MLLAGAPSINLRLIATYTRVLRLASNIRLTLVSLNSSDVSSVKAVSSCGNLPLMTMGPTWRQAIENCEGSSATPKVPAMPPVLA